MSTEAGVGRKVNDEQSGEEMRPHFSGNSISFGIYYTKLAYRALIGNSYFVHQLIGHLICVDDLIAILHMYLKWRKTHRDNRCSVPAAIF